MNYDAIIRKTKKGFLTNKEMLETLDLLGAEEVMPIQFGVDCMGVIAPKRLHFDLPVGAPDNYMDNEILEDFKDFILHCTGTGNLTEGRREVTYTYNGSNILILYDEIPV